MLITRAAAAAATLVVAAAAADVAAAVGTGESKKADACLICCNDPARLATAGSSACKETPPKFALDAFQDSAAVEMRESKY